MLKSIKRFPIKYSLKTSPRRLPILSFRPSARNFDKRVMASLIQNQKQRARLLTLQGYRYRNPALPIVLIIHGVYSKPMTMFKNNATYDIKAPVLI